MSFLKLHKKFRWMFILALLCFLIALLGENGLINNSDKRTNASQGEQLREFLEDKVAFIQNSLDFIYTNDSLVMYPAMEEELKDNNVRYSYFEDGIETDWQGNSFSFDKTTTDSTVSLRLVENGWYIMGSRTLDSRRLVCYYQFFSKEYKQNKSIQFEFNKDVPVRREIEFQPKEDESDIFTLFSVGDKEVKARFINSPVKPYLIWLYVGFFFFIFLYLISINLNKDRFDNWKFVKAYFLIMLGSRILYYFSLTFTELRNTKFFAPEVYASSFMSSSIGDITIDILLWLPIVFYLNHEHNPIIKTVRKWFVDKPLHSEIVLNIMVVGLSFLLTTFVRQLILDSTISFTLYTAGSINFYTYVGVFLLFLMVLGVSFSAFAFGRMFGRVDSRRQKLILLIVFVCLLTLLTFWRESLSYWGALMCYVFLYATTRIVNIKKRTITPILYVLFFNFLFTILISYYVNFKEKEYRKTFAIKALFGYDLEAEDLLFTSDEKIANDPKVQNYFAKYKRDDEQVNTLLKRSYFTGYLNKYDLEILNYSLKNGNVSYRDKESYNKYNLIYENAGRSIGENFRALSTSQKQGDYIGRFLIASDSLINGALFVTLKAKTKVRESNFYSTINSSSWMGEDVRNYSYALYEGGNLTKSFGDYNYPVRLKYRPVFDFKFINDASYSHLNYSDDGHSQLVVSVPRMSFTEWISIFLVLILDAVIVALFTILFLTAILWVCKRLEYYPFFENLRKGLVKIVPFLETKNIYFSTKLHLSMFTIVILTFAVTLLITMRYVRNNYYERQEVVLKDKMQRIVKALEGESKGKKVVENGEKIYSLSYERGLDINVFDANGDLLTASNNVIFDDGLIGPKLNRNAFGYFKETFKQEYQLSEHIGELNYLSAYYAVYNDKNEVSYYVNVPYFTQKSELETEISSYVVNLINFYGLVLIVSFLVAYFLSQNLAKPLVLIRQSIGGIKLGKENKQIVWKNNDEIGLLVERYNQMVKEIEDNAKLLASSEREGAWREMAKQVAHEIKNPLTPMKLQVQMLRKSWMEKDPNLDERFDKVSKLLLERMDAMAEMAIQFSSFSKMPKAQIEVFDLYSVLQDMVELHTGVKDFDIEFKGNEGYFVSADKEQLARVFTNLIQNAKQAIPEGRQGKLIVYLKSKDSKVVCLFKDNGKGISDGDMSKIFVPNFSTKNSGMGMGLAICKKIVESFQGQILFKSKLGKGTTFFVILPQIKPENH